jgi:hypothetical protein
MNYFEETIFFRKFPYHNYGNYQGPWIENYYQTNHTYNGPINYLPIPWTDLWCYIYYNPEKALEIIIPLKNFIENLPKDKIFYTIIQHDHGPFLFRNKSPFSIEFPNNIIVFSSTGLGHFTIPLLKDPSLFNYPTINFQDRKYLISFIGRIDPSNDFKNIRSRINIICQENFKEDYYHFFSNENNDWINLMTNSIYSICPRGNANTSFRLYEAIYLETIPIYIYTDKPVLPFQELIPWNSICHLIEEKDIEKIPNIILNETPLQRQKKILLLKHYKHFLTYYFTTHYIDLFLLPNLSK